MKATYKTEVICENCGARKIAEYMKGHSVILNMTVVCDYCGCCRMKSFHAVPIKEKNRKKLVDYFIAYNATAPHVYLAALGIALCLAEKAGTDELLVSPEEFEQVKLFMTNSGAWDWDKKTFLGMEFVIYEPDIKDVPCVSCAGQMVRSRGATKEEVGMMCIANECKDYKKVINNSK